MQIFTNEERKFWLLCFQGNAGADEVTRFAAFMSVGVTLFKRLPLLPEVAKDR
jgi:hypothetical protein